MSFSYKYVTIALVVLFAAIIVSCSKSDLQNQAVFSAEKLFFKGEKIKQNILTNPEIASPEDYEKAEQAYREIIDKFSSGYEDQKQIKGIVRRSWLTLAQLALMQKKDNETMQIYKEIIKRSPEDIELCAVAQFSLAQLYERANQFDDAIAAYQIVFQDYPPVLSDTLLPNLNILNTPLYMARLYRQKENVLMADQQYEQARNYYSDVMQKYPESDVSLAAQNQIAMTYGDQGNWNKAVEVLNDMIFQYSDDPKIIGTMFTLGTLYFQQLGEQEKALETFQQILQKFPEEKNLGQVHLAIGNIYFSQKRYDDARNRFQHILANYKADDNSCINAQLGIAKSYEDQNNWNTAVNEYQWIVENYPRTIQALNIPLYIAEHYRSSQETNLAKTAYESAIKQYQQVVEQYPNTPLAVMALDNTVSGYLRLEQWEQAAKILQNLTAMELPPQGKVKAYLTLENIYEEKLNDPAKALEVYSELLAKYPQVPIAPAIATKAQELQLKYDSYKQNNTPPIASDIIAANAVSNSSVEIAWQENRADDFGFYKLIRAESPGVDLSGNVAAQLSNRGQVSFLDENLTPGATYYYKLFTFDKGGLQASSKEVAVRFEAKEIQAMIALQAQSSNWSSAQLSWSQYQEKDFDSYKIYRSTSPGVSLSSQLVKSVFDQYATRFEDDDLAANSTYYYKVYVYNSDGKCKPSNEIKVMTQANQPPAPVAMNRPINIDNTSIELSWLPSQENDFANYRVYRSEQASVSLNSPPVWMNSNKSMNKFKDTGLKPGKTYYYKVVVYDKGGLFAESNEIAVNK